MNAAVLIRELHAAGVTLSATGDRLHVEAPAGAVTPSLRQRIAENKVMLLAEVRGWNADTHTALLALADRLAVDRDHVHRLDDAGLVLLQAIGEGGMRSFLLAAHDMATRQAGKVPLDDTAPALCERCGPVFLHPDVAAVLPVVNGWPRALGCPWCAIRKAGGYIPRPHVACATCTSFQPDPDNPGAGMGRCACGWHHAQQRHACGTYRPATTKEANHD